MTTHMAKGEGSWHPVPHSSRPDRAPYNSVFRIGGGSPHSTATSPGERAHGRFQHAERVMRPLVDSVAHVLPHTHSGRSLDQSAPASLVATTEFGKAFRKASVTGDMTRAPRADNVGKLMDDPHRASQRSPVPSSEFGLGFTKARATPPTQAAPGSGLVSPRIDVAALLRDGL